MKRLLPAAMLVLVCALASYSQTPAGADRQVRVLNHIQRFEEESKVGWAVWAIVPNALKTGPLKGLVVGGFALRDKRHAKWVEFMGGSFVDTAGHMDLVADIRAAQNYRHVAFSEEFLYAFNSKRVIMPTTATTPLPVMKKLRPRFGSDSDIVRDSHGWHAGMGPRISIVIPKTANKLTVATAFQKGLFHQRNLWRTYLLFNW